MTTPAEYRQWAEECMQAMRTAMLPEVKAVLRTMAERWYEQARRAEQHAWLRDPAAASASSDEKPVGQPGTPAKSH